MSLDSTEAHGLVWAAAIRYQRSVVVAVVDAGAPLARPLGGSGGLVVGGLGGVGEVGELVRGGLSSGCRPQGRGQGLAARHVCSYMLSSRGERAATAE